jgi:hypothetical protein
MLWCGVACYGMPCEDPDPHQSGKLDLDLDPDPHQNQRVILEHWRIQIWKKVSGRIRIWISIKLKGRLRILILIRVKGRLRIRINEKSSVQIRINVMRIRNTGGNARRDRTKQDRTLHNKLEHDITR